MTIGQALTDGGRAKISDDPSDKVGESLDLSLNANRLNHIIPQQSQISFSKCSQYNMLLWDQIDGRGYQNVSINLDLWTLIHGNEMARVGRAIICGGL